MTGITVLGQQRPDAHLEELGSIAAAKPNEPNQRTKISLNRTVPER